MRNEIHVIVPSWHYFANPFKLQPLWELYFATLLEQDFAEQYAVKVIDLREMRKKNKTAAEVLAEYGSGKYYVYWIMKTADYQEIKEFVQWVRTHEPQSKHFAGGTHVDNFVAECEKTFDAIVTGPGDSAFTTMINDDSPGELKKHYGYDWRKSPYKDFPYPKREFLPVESIVNRELFAHLGNYQATSVMFQRGCIFKCGFCVYNVPGTIQAKTLSAILDEIHYLKSTYQLEAINLRDEIAIPLAYKTAMNFLDTLQQGEIVWRGQTKVGANKKKMQSEEVLKLAAASGCKELAIGVESVNQTVLDMLDKKQGLEQVYEFIELAKKYAIKIKVCLILGLPGEDNNIVQDSIAFLEQTQPEFVNISGFDPVPGSRYHREAKKYGIKHIDEDFSAHAHLMGKFGKEEEFGLPFEYEKNTPWGKSFTREQIISNIRELQQYCLDKGMIY